LPLEISDELSLDISEEDYRGIIDYLLSDFSSDVELSDKVIEILVDPVAGDESDKGGKFTENFKSATNSGLGEGAQSAASSKSIEDVPNSESINVAQSIEKGESVTDDEGDELLKDNDNLDESETDAQINEEHLNQIFNEIVGPSITSSSYTDMFVAYDSIMLDEVDILSYEYGFRLLEVDNRLYLAGHKTTLILVSSRDVLHS